MDPECLLDGLEKQSVELKFRKNLARTCIDRLRDNVVCGDFSGHVLPRDPSSILQTNASSG